MTKFFAKNKIQNQGKSLLSERTNIITATNEHELEPVGKVKGADYVNDAKSNTLGAVKCALGAMKSKVVLIIGGNNDSGNYEVIEDLVKEKVSGIVYLGTDSSVILDYFIANDLIYLKAINIEEAVSMASMIVKKDEVVLFSPGCDYMEGYKTIGNRFKKTVKQLM